MNNQITLYLRTNDKAQKQTQINYNGKAITIDDCTVEMFTVAVSHYGAPRRRLYAHTDKGVYLFTMTEGFLEMFDDLDEHIYPAPALVVSGIVELFDVTYNR